MNQASVLIVSDDTEFAQTLTARWQSEPSVPAITVIDGHLWSAALPTGHEVVILGPVRHGSAVPQGGTGGPAARDSGILAALDPDSIGAAGVAVCVARDADAVSALRAQHPGVLVIPQREGWADVIIQLASEVLRRQEAVERARRAERIAAACQGQATLGRFMLEMRHNLNNALTSVLGNADLLLLAPGQFSAEARSQVQTIHNMALRLHEIMQRFSSLAVEVELNEKESQSETKTMSHMVASRM